MRSAVIASSPQCEIALQFCRALLAMTLLRHHDNCSTMLVTASQFLVHNADALWAVQKWHTSARKISLHHADCLAKINRAGWRG
jgi:hypothetical protein